MQIHKSNIFLQLCNWKLKKIGNFKREKKEKENELQNGKEQMAIFLKSFNAFDRISKIKKSPADIFYSSPSRG